MAKRFARADPTGYWRSMLTTMLLALSLQTSAAEAFPPVALPEAVRMANCADQADRAVVVPTLHRFINEVGPQLRVVSQTLERVQRNREQRLISRGLWTARDGQRFAAQLVRQSEFQAYLAETNAMVERLRALLQAVMAQSASEADRCTALLAIAHVMVHAPAVAARGWRAIDTAFTAEEARLGFRPD